MPGGAALVVQLASPRPDNWLHVAGPPVLPSMVATAIRQALAHGWRPDRPGSPFILDLGGLAQTDESASRPQPLSAYGARGEDSHRPGVR
ncbi:hypothetical protein FXF53_12195 [Micromonospora sp. WP24]|nr:hypothetical protein FXF53_12195 [Micromonospora sp. WP24]